MSIVCSKSGNSNWFNKEYHQKIVTTGQLRIVDATNLPTTKNAYIYLRNVEGSFEEEVYAWRTIPFSLNKPGFFTLTGDNYISTEFGLIKASANKVYVINNTSIVEQGTTTGGKFNVVNSSDSNKKIQILRDGYTVDERVLTPSSTKSFLYQYKFYIGIREFSKAEAAPDISTINTEINMLGVVTADISVAYSSSVYSMSLTNIVF